MKQSLRGVRTRVVVRRCARVLAAFILMLLFGLSASSTPPVYAAPTTQTDIAGPAGSGQFGAEVVVLPNGNIVVTDPNFSEGGVNNIGAVYLYNGATLAVISALKGGTLNDQVGYPGVTALTNGNYVVRSTNWANPTGPIAGVGAATWGNGAGGTGGLVTSSNSLIGGTAGDNVGGTIGTALPNGNYVVESNNWDNPSGPITDARAVTLGNGTSGTAGLITSANSVLGTVTNGISGFSYDYTRNRLFVGRAASNIVSILSASYKLWLPLILR